ncbi:MAG: leucine-rich repeat domain-containing protein, partial [Spirochaetales bacterium]|nr:leucine-rich repeat domain-containing protein [Spirochaetales bacterium]
ARNYSLQLGRCDNGGLGGGNTIYLDGTFLGAISRGSPNAFWHEFSHCMGWGHHNGNMCCEGLPPPFNVDWPSIGSKLYQDEYKKGTTPYLFDKHYLNSNFFSIEYRRPKPIQHDVIRKGTLYIGDKMPCTGSHKDWHDFTKVEMPSTVELISDSAFCGTPIREFTIPPQVRIIGKEAFKDCRFIENIDIPDNIKQAGNAAFQDCTLLSKVKIGKGLRQLNFRLFKGSGLKEITIPKNIQLIESEAFADCKKLKKVVIEEGVRKINDKAFDNTALTEITIPASVTMFGKNITSKDVVWNVKPGTAAYEYAKENNYKIKLSPEDLNKITSQVLAECKNAVEAPADKWETETFPAYDNRYKWDFSSSLKGSGEYNVTFTYNNGASMICLTDALVAADGKAIAYFPETRTAGSKSKQIVYTFNVPNGTKKLELFAFAKRSENKTSNGTVTAESTAEYEAKILAESANVEPVSPDGWENGVFTKNDVLRKWDFSDKINGINGGDYVFKFSYIDGSDTLRLTDSLFIADGKVIGHY